jgi:RHS repeat-associated protein
MEHGNGTYTQHNYDPESTRLTSIVSSRFGPAGELQNKSYQYTPAGNIKGVTDNVKGIDYNYTYDKLHRLKTETNTGAFDSISYSYDAIGNIMSKTVGASTMVYNYEGPRPHTVKEINLNGTNYNYTYDDNGNMIGGSDFTDPQQVAQRAISYNADNMPLSISHTKTGNSVTTDFVYDSGGGRAKKTVTGGSTTYYIGDHFEIKDGVATKFIFAGNLRVAKVTGTGIKYFHKDHLGSSTVITDNDGNAIETAEYTPFGGMRDHTGSNASSYKFTDQEFDAASGLYNYNARLYDPVIGRFISTDPYVQAPFDPQTLNRYSYVRNNPLIYVDPSGYSWFSKAWKKVKRAVKKGAKKVAKAVVSVVASKVLTHAIFSVVDIGVPGLGQAIAFGIGYLSTRFADYAVDKIWGGNNGGGGGGGPPISGNAGGRLPSGSSGGGYTGPLFPAGTSAGGGYAAISGTTYDFAHGYSANVVSNGHVFYGPFYQAIGKIYSGVVKGLVEGAKGAVYSTGQTAHALLYNEGLGSGLKFGFTAAGVVFWEATKIVGIDVFAAYTNKILPLPAVAGFFWGKSLSALIVFPFGFETHKATAYRTAQRIQWAKNFYFGR